MKKAILILLVFLTACSDKIEKSLDPISKTQIIFKTILNENDVEVRKAYVGDLAPGQENMELVKKNNALIRKKLKKHGLPDKTQISFIEEKVPANHFYKHICVKDSIKSICITTTVFPGSNDTIKTTFWKTVDNLQIFDIEPNNSKNAL